MSETTNEVAAKPAKATPVQTKVQMEDGREVVFVGKRRMLKESTVSEDGTVVTSRFDFVNGATRSFSIDLTDPLAPKFIGHGIEQKVGDETAGDESVEDMVLHVDNILERLNRGEWGAERGSGDGFSGASTVIRAICEVTNKDVAWVKDWLEKKLAAGKETGLTRQKLYAGFRAPDSKTAPVIARIEAERASKASGINANDALDEIAEG